MVGCLALLTAAHLTPRDGEKIFVDENLLNQSVNAQLVVAGLSYVEPYDTMPLSLIKDLRKLIAEGAQEAGTRILAAGGCEYQQRGRDQRPC